MGYIKDLSLTRAQVAAEISDVNDYTIGGYEVEIDGANYSKQDGTYVLEGALIDTDGDKHYVEIFVNIESVEVDPVPYEWADGREFDEDYEGDEDD